MKNCPGYLLKACLLASMLLISSAAYASVTPTLGLSLENDNNTVELQISADPNTRITLNYTTQQGAPQYLYLGTTDTEGYLSATVSSSVYQIPNGDSVYVTSGTGNVGPHSATRTWPSPPTAKISVPSDTLDLGIGESSIMPVYNLINGSLVLKTNSNPAVASVSVNGPQVTVHGVSAGTTNITVCLAVNGNDCASFTGNVGNTSATRSSSSSFSFTQTSPALVVGTTTLLSINGPSNTSFYVSSNSNPSVAQANITYNLVTIYGNAVGSTAVTVCNGAGQCASFTVTVFPATNSSTVGPTLSQSSAQVSVGQSTTVLIAGIGGYTVTSRDVSTAKVSVSNYNNLIITGVAYGSTSILVCDRNKDCISIPVSVTNPPPPQTAPSSATTTASAPAFTFTKYLSVGSNGVEVTALQDVLAVLGYFTTTANGNYGPATKAAVIKFQAAHGLPQLGVVGPATRAALNALASGSTDSTASSNTPSTSDNYTFSNFIGMGSTGTDVTELQKRLTTLGIYSGPITGHYGSLTAAAVSSFQKAHGIKAAGYVGPSTRAALNAH